MAVDLSKDMEDLAAARAELAALPHGDGERDTYRRASALLKVGGTLVRLKRFDEAIKALDEAEILLSNTGHSTLSHRILLTGARHWKALALKGQSRFQAAWEVHSQIDLPDRTDPQMRPLRAEILALRLQLLGTLERLSEVLDESRAVLDDYDGELLPEERDTIALTHHYQAIAALHRGQLDLALQAEDRAISMRREIYRETNDLHDRHLLARCMFGRANILDARGERRATSAALLAFIRSARGLRDRDIQLYVRRARMRRLGILIHAPYVLPKELAR